MPQPFKGVSITIDQVRQQFREFSLVSGNGPKLIDPVSRQIILSTPDIYFATSAVAEPVLTTDALSPGHTVPTGMSVRGKNLGVGESQSCTPPPSLTDNQSHEPDTGLLPTPCERDMEQRVPYTTFIDFGISHGHTSARFEDQDSSVAHDHDHTLDVDFFASPAQLLPVGLQTRTGMAVDPEILSRFLRVDSLNDSLRHEASIAIYEGRVQEGEDILKRKMLEECWQWHLGSLSTTIAPGQNTSHGYTPTQWSHSIENNSVAGRIEDNLMEDDLMEDDLMEDGRIYEGQLDDD